MEPVLKYYTYNDTPNDEEINTCISIAERNKSTVMLYFNDEITSVKFMFVHPKDTFEIVKARVLAISKHMNGD